MFDFGISEIGVIGVVALVVLGPEKLPRVARTVGNLVGRAQRYLADVKSEVNRHIELDELRNMRSNVETSVRDIQTSVAQNLDDINRDFDTAWKDATSGLYGQAAEAAEVPPLGRPLPPEPAVASPPPPKRLKRAGGAAQPLWYRRQARVRTRVLSGAARSARQRRTP